MKRRPSKIELLVACLGCMSMCALDCHADVASDYVAAREFYAAGKWDQAKAILKSLILSDPIRAEPHYLLANIYYQKGDVEEAVPEYALAVEREPKSQAAMLSNEVLSKLIAHSQLTMPQLPQFGNYKPKWEPVDTSKPYAYIDGAWRNLKAPEPPVTNYAPKTAIQDCDTQVNEILKEKNLMIRDNSSLILGDSPEQRADCAIRKLLITNAAEKRCEEIRAYFRSRGNSQR